jgi:hypothetical protein
MPTDSVSGVIPPKPITQGNEGKERENHRWNDKDDPQKQFNPKASNVFKLKMLVIPTFNTFFHVQNITPVSRKAR